MTHLLRITCLISAILSLSACSIGGEKAAVPAAPSAVAANTAATTITPTITGSPSPSYQEAYPGVATIEMDTAYPVPTSRWTPGPEMGYPADVLTLTATAPTPTSEPSPTPTITSTVTITPTPGPPTITPFPEKPTLTPPPILCEYHHQDREEYPLPDLSQMRWVEVQEDGRRAMRLTGDAQIHSVSSSPDGPGLALHIPRMIGGPTTIMGLVVVNGAGETPWLAIQSFDFDYHAYAWLPGNRLMYIDDGVVYTAKADGSEKVIYQNSEKMVEFWSNGSMAIVSGEENLWLLNLQTKIWYKKKGIASISGSSSNAKMDPDGRYLWVNAGGTLAQVPMTQAEPITWYQGIKYGGRGRRIGSPQVMAGNPYVFPGEVEYLEDGSRRVVVFRIGNPEPIPLDSIIGPIIGLKENQHVSPG